MRRSGMDRSKALAQLGRRIVVALAALLGTAMANAAAEPAAPATKAISRQDAGAGRSEAERAVIDALLDGRDARAAIGASRESAPAQRRTAHSPRQAPRAFAGFVDHLQQVRAAMSASRAAHGASANIAANSRLTKALLDLSAQSLLVDARLEQIDQTMAAPATPSLLRSRWADQRARVSAMAQRLSTAASSLTRSMESMNAHDAVPSAMLAELEHLLAQEQAATSPAIYGANLPVFRPRLPPREPDTSAAVTPTYADSVNANEPLADDLTGTDDAPLSPAIMAQAQSLGYEYTRIVDFVRSQVRTQWYAGAQKGAETTLRTLSGNDVDQASLLIALLRASGGPARYVRGVVQVPVNDLVDMLGVRADRVGLALSAAGVANRPVAGGGHIAAYAIEQVYVSAYLPMSNYRGSAADLAGRTWIPLAPALKPHHYQPAAGALARLGINATQFLQQYLTSAQTQLPLDLLRQTVTEGLARQSPPLSYASQLAQRLVDAAPLELLPASLPYPAVSVSAEFARLPESLRQHARIVIRNGSELNNAIVLERELPISELIGRRVTISYAPYSIDDGRIADRYGGMGSTPPSLIHVRPLLNIAGLPAVQGSGDIDNAARHRVDIELIGPAGSVALSQQLTAGGLAAVVFDAQQDGAPQQADSVTLPGESEPKAARILANFGARYLSSWDNSDDESAQLIGVSVMRPFPSVALVINQYAVQRVAGVVDSMQWNGVALDAALRPAEAFLQNDTAATESDWTQLSALQGSVLEHQLFEQQWLVDSISADKGLALARSQNLPVLSLNSATGTAGLQQSADVIANIAGWLARGYQVEVPRDPLTYQSWTGAVWRVTAPSTGESGYFIAGGLAGGATAMPPALWFFQDLADLLANPYSDEPNDNPLSAVVLSLDGSAQSQVGVVGTELDQPLAAVLLDVAGRPVQGGSVTFRVNRGNARLLDPLLGETAAITVLTDRNGIAKVALKLGTSAGDLGLYQLIPGLSFPQWLGFNEIEVSADSSIGVLYSGEPYRAYSYPDEPAKLTYLGDPDRRLEPGIGYRAFTARVTDRFDNEISNATIELSGTTQYTAPDCGIPNPPHVDTIDASLFEPGQCPSEVVRLTGNACTRPTLTTQSRPGGAPFFIVPPATGLATYELQGAAGTATKSLQMRTDDAVIDICSGQPLVAAAVWLQIPTHGSVPWLNENLRPVIGAARPGELIPVPLRMDVLRATLTAGDHAGLAWSPVEGATFAPELQGGSLENLREVGGGTYFQDLRAGPEPGSIHGVIRVFVDGLASALRLGASMVSGPNGYAYDDTYGWSVDPRPIAVTPAQIPLTAFSATDSKIRLQTTTAPTDYVAAPIMIQLLRDNEVVAECAKAYGDGDSYCEFGRGILVDTSKQYTARAVLNDGTPFVLTSAPTPLLFGQGIIAGYGVLPRHSDSIGGPPGGSSTIGDDVLLLQNRFPKSISIQDQIDIPSGYACTAGSRLGYLLSQDASVTLTFHKLDSQGNPSPIQAWQPLEGVAQSAGLHEVLVSADDLGFGDFEFQLDAVAADGSVETRRGVASHHPQRHDALPLAHPFVKGVDLYHGGAVLSEEDIAIGGRGPGMNLTRTYSSHSGDERGFFGRGWSADLDSQVLVDNCDTRIVTGGAGQGQRFVSVGATPDGGWRFDPLSGFHGSLVQHGADYDFYSKDGTRHHFAQQDISGPRLSTIEDTNGNRVSYAYELNQGKPRVTRISDTAGRTIDLTYKIRDVTTQQSGFDIRETYTVVSSASGPGGLRLNYEYDAVGNLVKVTRFDGGTGTRVSGYTYSDLGGVITTDPDGNGGYYHFGYRMTDATNLLDTGKRSFVYQLGWSAVRTGDQLEKILYLPEQRVTTLTEPDAGVTGFAYAGTRGLNPVTSTVTDARGHLRSYGLNRYGAAETLQDEVSITTTEWDLVHLQPHRVVDALNTVSTYEYDAAGNRTSATIEHAAGTVTRQWTYAPATAFASPYIRNRVATATDANAHVTTTDYDPRGNPVRIERGGVAETMSYSANGDRASRSDGLGKTWIYRYDEFGFPAEIEDPLHHVDKSHFDARGRVLSRSDANGATTTYTYDSRDRVLKTTFPATDAGVAVQTSAYDDLSNARRDTNPRAFSTLSVFDRMGRLLRVEHPDGGVRALTYDVNGNTLTDTSFNGEVTRFDYDGVNRLTDRHEPEDRLTHYDYDALGHVLRETVSAESGDDARVTEFVYDDPLYQRTLLRKRLDAPGGSSWLEERTAFDGVGNPIQRSDALGRITTLIYDARDRLIEQSEPLGKRTQFSYDAADRKLTETRANPSGSGEQVRSWVYDDAGRPTDSVDATGARSRIAYDPVGNAIRLTDARQNRIDQTWDARHHLLSQSGPELGQRTDYHMDLNGNVDGETWANGNALTHSYDKLDRRLLTVDALGNVEATAYDRNGNPTHHTDANAHTTIHHYDALQRLVRQDLPSLAGQPRQIVIAYNVHNQPIARTDPGLHLTGTVYDSVGRATQTRLPAIDGVIDTLSVDYDAVGNPIGQTDARGHVTAYTVNALNRRIGQTDPADEANVEHTQVWAYDEVGNPVSHTDRNGVITLTAYDKENRDIGRMRDGLLLEAIERDAVGNPLQRTDANGALTTTVFDKANRPIEVHRKDSAGSDTVQRWTYTALGEVASSTDADGRTTLHTYTKRRYPDSDTNHAGETTQYSVDGIGQRLSTQRPASPDHTWTHTYDEADRLASVTDPLGHTTTYSYDADGNRLQISDANAHLTTFAFDARHRVTDKTLSSDAGIATTHWTYNADGHVLTETNPDGRTLSHTVDALGRRTQTVDQQAQVGDAATRAFVYDGNGNLTAIHDTLQGGGVRDQTTRYDAFDRPEHQVDVTGGVIDWTYDANGNRTRAREDGEDTVWTYDPLNRNTAITVTGQGTTTLDYFPSGLLKQVTRPDGSTTEHGYDAAGRLETLAHAKAGSAIAQLRYRYDLNGNRIEQKETNGPVTGDAEQTSTYTYDRADRLIEEVAPDRSVVYTLDPVGNRTDETEKDPQGNPTATHHYSYDASDALRTQTTRNGQGQLIATRTTTYDKSGNRIEVNVDGAVTTYRSDTRGQLTDVTPGTGSAQHYSNDAAGLRIGNDHDGIHTGYRYDNGRLRSETNAIGNTTRRYHRAQSLFAGAALLLSTTQAGSTPTHQHYLWNAEQSPVATVTQAGAVSSRTRYAAYGEVRAESGSNDQPVRFQGYLQDEAGDTLWAYARRYSPTSGRFTSRDPEDGSDLNPISRNGYLAFNGAPLTFTDPSGRKGCDSTACELVHTRDLVRTDEERARIDALIELDQSQKARAAPYVLAGILLGPLAAETAVLTASIGLDTLASGSLLTGLTLHTAGLQTTGVVAVETGAAFAVGAMVPSAMPTSAAATASRMEATEAGAAASVARATSGPTSQLKVSSATIAESASGRGIAMQDIVATRSVAPITQVSESEALKRIASNNANGQAATSVTGFRVTIEGKSSGGRGLGAIATVDRIGHEYVGAVQQANRILQTNRPPATAWERVYRNYINRGEVPPDYVRGNALQQLADDIMRANRYARDANVLINRQSRVDVLKPLRPDVQVPLGPTTQGVLDITTPKAAPKINKYDDPANQALINILYEQQ